MVPFMLIAAALLTGGKKIMIFCKIIPAYGGKGGGELCHSITNIATHAVCILKIANSCVVITEVTANSG